MVVGFELSWYRHYISGASGPDSLRSLIDKLVGVHSNLQTALLRIWSDLNAAFLYLYHVDTGAREHCSADGFGHAFKYSSSWIWPRGTRNTHSFVHRKNVICLFYQIMLIWFKELRTACSTGPWIEIKAMTNWLGRREEGFRITWPAGVICSTQRLGRGDYRAQIKKDRSYFDLCRVP